MTEATFSVEAALQAIRSDGFFCLEDPEVGRDISEMEAAQTKFSASTMPGLEFYKRRVLEDVRVRSVLESSFEWCALGDYRRLWDDYPNIIFQLRRGGTRADILVVQLWKAGSEAIYYRASHTMASNSVRASNKMFEVPRAMVERAAVEGVPKAFHHGAIVIMDARLAFQSKKGSHISFAFATKDQLHYQKWPALKPPDNAEQLLAEVRTDKIGAHFLFDECL